MVTNHIDAMTKTTDKTRDQTPQLTGLLQAEPDLVDRIFDYLLLMSPRLAEALEDVGQAKEAVRDEFGGEKVYVRSGNSAAKRTQESRAMAEKVLSLFNGRNASEIARELNISRATVYRLLKQSGRDSR